MSAEIISLARAKAAAMIRANTAKKAAECRATPLPPENADIQQARHFAQIIVHC